MNTNHGIMNIFNILTADAIGYTTKRNQNDLSRPVDKSAETEAGNALQKQLEMSASGHVTATRF